MQLYEIRVRFWTPQPTGPAVDQERHRVSTYVRCVTSACVRAYDKSSRPEKLLHAAQPARNQSCSPFPPCHPVRATKERYMYSMMTNPMVLATHNSCKSCGGSAIVVHHSIPFQILSKPTNHQSPIKALSNYTSNYKLHMYYSAGKTFGFRRRSVRGRYDTYVNTYGPR